MMNWKRILLRILFAASISLGLVVYSSEIRPGQSWTDWSGPAGAPRLHAKLVTATVHPETSIAVEVEVEHIFLNHPELPRSYGVPTGVLRYQLDQETPVITTDNWLKFEPLTRGAHSVQVTLLGADERPVGPPARLSVQAP